MKTMKTMKTTKTTKRALYGAAAARVLARVCAEGGRWYVEVYPEELRRDAAQLAATGDGPVAARVLSLGSADDHAMLCRGLRREPTGDEWATYRRACERRYVAAVRARAAALVAPTECWTDRAEAADAARSVGGTLLSEVSDGETARYYVLGEQPVGGPRTRWERQTDGSHAPAR